MMNKIFNVFFWTIVLIVLCLVVLKLFSGTLNEGIETEAHSGDLEVKLSYNSISADNRKVFGYLVPYGIVWRTGADDATKITFSKEAYFGGKKIKKGSYSLWSLPDKKKWIVILNKESGQYGTNYDSSKNYAQVEIVPKRLNENQDNLRIHLVKKTEGKIDLVIRWEETEVTVPIKESI